MSALLRTVVDTGTTHTSSRTQTTGKVEGFQAKSSGTTSSTTRSSLARRLRLPDDDGMSPSGCAVVVVLVLVVLVGGVFTSFASPGLAAALAFVVAAPAAYFTTWRPMVRGERRRAARAAPGREVWGRSYYCGRDDVVFGPDLPEPLTPEAFRELLTS